MKKAFLQLHIAVLLAGFTGILGELISLNAGLLVWYRLLITAVTLWVLMSVTGKLEKIPVKEALKIGGIGFVSALHWVLFYASIKYGNVSIGLVCLSAVGFFSAILEPLLTRQPIKKENYYWEYALCSGSTSFFILMHGSNWELYWVLFHLFLRRFFPFFSNFR